MEETVLRLMKRGAITCSEEASVREVAQIMVVNRIRYCVVVNQKHEVLGIISARSILRAFGRGLDSTEAKDILLPYTVTITPRSPLSEATESHGKEEDRTPDCCLWPPGQQGGLRPPSWGGSCP